MTHAADRLSSALETVLANFAGMVRQVGWRYRLSDADIDEVMQEVRIRLWRARQDGEQIAQVSASYVYRTASSAALDVIRRRRSRRADMLESLDEAVDAPAAALPSADHEFEGAELAAQVAQAVEEITPSRRPVVRMYLAGYDRHEIADTLGWSEAKTRNLLYRGLADLRARLTERGIGWESAE